MSEFQTMVETLDKGGFTEIAAELRELVLAKADVERLFRSKFKVIKFIQSEKKNHNLITKIHDILEDEYNLRFLKGRFLESVPGEECYEKLAVSPTDDMGVYFMGCKNLGNPVLKVGITNKERWDVIKNFLKKKGLM